MIAIEASGDRVALPEGIIVKSHVVTSERMLR